MAKLQPYYDLLSQAANAIDLDEKYIEIDYDETDFDFTIRVCGGGWDQKIDQRHARFVLELQKALDGLQDQLTGGATAKENRKLVRIEIEKGSSIISVEMNEFLKSVVGNMNSTEQVIVFISGILAIAGVVTVGKLLSYKTKVAEFSKEERTQELLASAVQKLADKLPNYEKPARSLINSMGPDDTIRLPESDEPMTRNQAKELYPRSPRVTPTQYYIDDDYLVTDINLEDGFVRLRCQELEFKASLALNTGDTRKFYDRVKEKRAANEAAEVLLSVTAQLNPRGVKAAAVVGVGEKRDAAKNIMDALRDAQT